jgi:aspartate carbamoyltransferase catalytic subunit
MLRIQTEREKHNIFPSLREYAQRYSLNLRNIGLAHPDVIVMHPGPMNRGIEISPDIADGPYSVILDQVTNGVAVRMAILYLLTGGAS